MGELRGRKEFDYIAFTYPNKPRLVNIVHPSAQAAPEHTQPILHHLSVYWGGDATICPIERLCPLRPNRNGNVQHISDEPRSPLYFCGEKEGRRSDRHKFQDLINLWGESAEQINPQRHSAIKTRFDLSAHRPSVNGKQKLRRCIISDSPLALVCLRSNAHTGSGTW